MKNIISIIFLSLLAFVTNAQQLNNTFNMKVTAVAVVSSNAPDFTVNLAVTDASLRFTGNDAVVGDYLYCYVPSGKIHRFTITSMPTKTGTLIQAVVNDPSGTITIFPTTGVIIARQTALGIIQDVANVDNAYKSIVENHNKELLNTQISSKQNVLVSGSTLKTVNGESLLGSGNVSIAGSGSTDLSKTVDATKVVVESSSGADVTLNAANSATAGVMTAAHDKTLNFTKTRVFDVREYGILPDGGTADYTTLYRRLLDTVTVKGGGIIYFPAGVYKMNGKIIYPVTYPGGVGTIPRQVNIIIEGAGSHRTGNSQADNNYGTVILLGYNSATPTTTDTLGRWCFRGSGNVEIRNITFRSPGTTLYNTSFMHFTLTSSQIHHCAFVGSQYSYSNFNQIREDVIEYGGSSYTEVLDTVPTAAFQGYGTTLYDNFFNQIQSAANFNSLANAITVQDNWFGHHCGGLAAFRDMTGVQVAGNNFIANRIEMSTYKHAFKFNSTTKSSFIGNSFYDHNVLYTSSDYQFDGASAWHYVQSSFSQAPNYSIPMVNGVNRNKINYIPIEPNDTTKFQTSVKIDDDSRLYLKTAGPYSYNSTGSYITYNIGSDPNTDFTFYVKRPSEAEKSLLTFRDAGSNNTIIASANANVTGGTTFWDAYDFRLRATNYIWLGNANNNYILGGTHYNNADDFFRVKQSSGLFWSDGATAASAKSVGLSSTVAGTLRVIGTSTATDGNLQAASITATTRTGTPSKLASFDTNGKLVEMANPYVLSKVYKFVPNANNVTTVDVTNATPSNGTIVQGSAALVSSDLTSAATNPNFQVYVNGLRANVKSAVVSTATAWNELYIVISGNNVSAYNSNTGSPNTALTINMLEINK